MDAPDARLYKKMRGGSPENYTALIDNIREAVKRNFRVRPCYLMSRINTTDEILRDIIYFSYGLGVSEVRLQRFKPWGSGSKLAKKYEIFAARIQSDVFHCCSYRCAGCG